MPTTILLLLLLPLVYKFLLSPLLPPRNIPGPFWARFSRLWYLNLVRQGHFETANIRLHEQYGPVVRLAPNLYSLGDIKDIRNVYSTSSKYPKSAWYEAWSDPAKPSLFSERDPKKHADIRKKFTSLYTMSSLIKYEELVDSAADLFLLRLSEFAARGETIDLAYWFQCYAIDVIGNITFGQRFGFLDKGEDIAGTLSMVPKVFSYGSFVGIYAEWHSIIYNTMIRFRSSAASGREFILQFVQDNIDRHRDTLIITKDNNKTTQSFVSRAINAQKTDPSFTDAHVFMMSQLNVLAGTDTTAISLSAILYLLLQFPETLGKLRDEIQTSKCSERITFQESQAMPYLQAVIKEALRVHSAVGVPLWRVVPVGGAQINGRFFPPGSQVGVNPWVVHYNKDVFPDPASFRPERWIDADEANLKIMNEMFLPFGLGSRTCIGKHISILEMSKLIPRLVRDFDFSPQGEWKTLNMSFVKPEDWRVAIEKRQ
ncbi:hypothetical protein ASPZODRAFT_57998 [Penicilliopsis zonata CBS 506.65]|uniref:Ig-like domain-containing protein n=1 Tax=Penicilliopsis zonata CBS 506.65 TaxID=1073090 RepID=A0A1L9STC8_9EURO|nr:hypothetical protein ASPZODRAFT_57998 [Penicilliopsis zonata CBS 506.65]OJJ50337.1 hypothetical protein ASPZODRAFT_57998 [Penicilliopsis zonata CBS 506.65]